MDDSSVIMEFTRVYLAVFFSLVAVFYAARITTAKRAQARELVFPGARFSPAWWNHMVFRAFRVAIWAVCVLRLFLPPVDDYLGIIAVLNVPPVLVTGNVVLTAGFVFAIAIHVYLGRQWRSGIDPDGPESLRTGGVYAYSRNPMFLGVALAQAGFFLALPSVFSGICLLVGWYTLRRQAIAEEAHLMQRFAGDYRRYRDRVPRWLWR